MDNTQTEDSRGADVNRRRFLKTSAMAAVGTALFSGQPASAKDFEGKFLQVWSCGGLAEAFIPANQRYKEKHGAEVAYTGAFAAALGKSLLGSATTDVFGGRVLGLAKKLREAGKMSFFKPLCYTRYVMATPKGNPAGIEEIRDMARPGIRVIVSPEASPPGGQAVAGLMKKAGILDKAMANAVIKGTCVQRSMEALIEGKGDVSIVEYRVTRLPAFQDRAEIIDIPETYFPPPPLAFTIGVMEAARDRELAEHYLKFIRSPEGQGFFEKAGFISAISDKGREMTEKLGVKDV